MPYGLAVPRDAGPGYPGTGRLGIIVGILARAGAACATGSLSGLRFAQVKGLMERFQMVVRDGVEPPTFRFPV